MNTNCNTNTFQHLLKEVVAVFRSSVHKGGALCREKLKPR